MKAKFLMVVSIICVATLTAPAQTKLAPSVATFESSPTSLNFHVPPPPPGASPNARRFPTPTSSGNATLRYRIGISVGGSRIQVMFSNETGDKPLKIEHASLAVATGEMDAAPGTLREITFSGKPSIVIPAGEPALSDPVDLTVDSLTELLMSVYIPDGVLLISTNGGATMLSDGDTVLAEKTPASHAVWGRPPTTAILVVPKRPTKVVVALGDSITDPNRDKPTTPHGWVAVLAQRLVADEKKEPLAAVSAGISGNRLLEPGMGEAALARADRDVFSVPGIKYIIVLEGINDIGLSGSSNPIFGSSPELHAGDLEAGYLQIVNRAHALGIKVFAGTILPFRGAYYFTEDKEGIRTAVNTWMRNSNAFDGVVDFDAAVRDPASPDHLKAEFDSGDHLHPSAAGYKAMGDAIDLKLFK